MTTIKLTKDELRDLVYGDLVDYEEVQDGEWVVEHKWQYQENIVKHIPSGKYYSYSLSRSGSPYSDYYYSYEDDGTELQEVQQKEVTTVKLEWVPV